jgi:ribosome biogenesis GTPase
MQFNDLGWEQYQEKSHSSADSAHVARVLSENKTNYNLLSQAGERIGVLRGNTLRDLEATTKPKAGDWVRFSEDNMESLAVIEEILPRYSKLSRTASGESGEEQVLVANVDKVFIVQGLDGNFNLNRLERYLLMAENGGVLPVIVLNKSDLVNDLDDYIAQVQKVAPDVPVVALSATENQRIDQLHAHLGANNTSVFVGSSGVGKSTLLNALFGHEVQETKGVRNDDQGRHTTTRRELFMLPDGSIIIDTPGMRELNVKGMEETQDTFADIEALAKQCKYRKCEHDKTEGCAIQEAIDGGHIDEKRVTNYLKLLREIDFEESKHDHAKHVEWEAKKKNTEAGYRKVTREQYKRRGYR